MIASITLAPLAVAVAVLGFAGTVSAAPAAPTAAHATIVDATGRPVGTATFAALPTGAVEVSVKVSGFDPGPGGDHGLHVHAAGLCEWPAFATAGGHHNPGRTKHGLASPAGPHAGDLPNIQFMPDGSASLVAATTSFRIADLLDRDGSAVVIHAGPDDNLTDPSGNSGARIGCGVVAPWPAPTANS